MSKKLKIKFDGAEYLLEYTRTTALALEQAGFSLSDIKRKPVSSLMTLFRGAFMANHKRVETETVDRMFESMPDKTKLLSVLVGMYDETVSALMEDPSGDEGNAEWTAIP